MKAEEYSCDTMAPDIHGRHLTHAQTQIFWFFSLSAVNISHKCFFSMLIPPLPPRHLALRRGEAVPLWGLWPALWVPKPAAGPPEEAVWDAPLLLPEPRFEFSLLLLFFYHHKNRVVQSVEKHVLLNWDQDTNDLSALSLIGATENEIIE